MKRLMPTSLINFLAANPNCIPADCFTITLPNGAVMTATSGQFDVTIPSGTPGWSGNTTTFFAGRWGSWSRGPITSEASFNLSANTVDLTCIQQQGTTFPAMPIGMLSAARQGLFDASPVSIVTAYMPLGEWNNVSNGIETKFAGIVNSPKSIIRNKFVLECADYNYLLNVQIPQRILQSNCPWAFADANCAVPGGAGAFTTDFSAAAGTTANLLVPATAFTQAAGFFTQGVVTCLSGNNAGLAQYVKLHNAGGQLQLMFPWLIAPQVGDTFAVLAGCDKSATTCTQKFNNLIHFGGEPLTPVSTQAI